MKKSVLKIAAIFMALLTIHLQTFATSAGTTSSENEVVVNYDETEIYASFEEMNDLANYLSENDATYADVENYNSALVENVSSSAAIALSNGSGEPPFISAFWWGCIFNLFGLIVVYVTTDSDSTYTKAAWKGCILSGILYVGWGIFWRLVVNTSGGWF